MTVMSIKNMVRVCLSTCVLNAIAQDGVILPMDESGCSSNKCASIKIVLAKDDASIPRYMTVYKPISDFVASRKASNARVRVDGKICIYNNASWPYIFGGQYMRTGYYCLEIDMMQVNGNIFCIKKRKPDMLHENGTLIVLKPQRRWETLISFDRRLWDFPSGKAIGKIVKIRPRFAFGVYDVDGIYYRSLGEMNNGEKRNQYCDDRDGELIGDWIDFVFSENLNEEMSDEDEFPANRSILR